MTSEQTNHILSAERLVMLAYLDTFNGLVPCKVLRVIKSPYHGEKIVVSKVLATRGAYKRGEIVESGPHWVKPRTHVIKLHSKYGPRLLPYQWELTE